MTKKTVIVFLSLMLGIASKGYNASDISKQIIREVEPISPQADVLKKFGEYPMDYSTGVPNISIPLYEIKVGSYTLPISISYHASGIKVQDVSSPIGLGWALIAGGSIIRQIKGAVDKGTLVLKSEADVISNFNRGVFTSEGCAYLAAEHRLDTESDRYSYNFNGKNGIFRHDINDMSIKTIPYTPLRIEKSGSGYMITDTDGVRYYFLAEEKSRGDFTYGGDRNTSAWYLTKIVLAERKDSIELTYRQDKDYYAQFSSDYIHQGARYYFSAGEWNDSWGRTSDNVVDNNSAMHTTESSNMILTRITWRGNHIDFSYTNDREDCLRYKGGKLLPRLTSVTVYNNISSLIKQITFDNQHYTGSSNLCKRMFLKGVTFSGAFSSTNDEKYSFTYNSTELPNYFNFSFNAPSEKDTGCHEDYWGYYNGSSSDFWTPKECMPLTFKEKGANRSVVEKFAKAGIIERITYPTGGYTLFDFESNRLDNGTLWGGLRIKTIRTYDSDATLIGQKSYNYKGAHKSIDNITNLYRFDCDYIYQVNYFEEHYGNRYIFHDGFSTHHVSVSQPLLPLTADYGFPIYYTDITEYFGDSNNNLGKAIYSYEESRTSDYNKFDDIADQICNEPIRIYSKTYNIDHGNITTLLNNKKVYKKAGNEYLLDYSEDYNYEEVSLDTFLVGVTFKQRYVHVSLNPVPCPPTIELHDLDHFNSIYAYYDVMGMPSYKRIASKTVKDYGAKVTTTTTYTYDRQGRTLAPKTERVTSPAASDVVKTPGESYSIDTDEILQKFAYHYLFDHRNRCVAKKLPGCATIKYVYDNADRLIFSQDGNQRGSQWTFHLYDKFGREVVVGTTPTDNIPKLASMAVVATYTGNGGLKGYTCPLNLSNPSLLSVNYYDSYNFLKDYNLTSTLGYKNSSYCDTSFPSNETPEARGLLTGSWTAFLGDIPQGSFSTYYYGERERLVQKHLSNALGGYDSEYYCYDFTGMVSSKKHIHSTASTSQTELYSYKYDHAGRLLTTMYQLNSNSEVVLHQNTYDELGRLISRTNGGNSNLTEAYTYNVRSWPTTISAGSLFSETLYYDESHDGSTPQFGGNISAMTWKSDGKTRGYKFGYDNFSRLLKADYMENGSSCSHYTTAYSYDNMGNILKLKRHGLQDGGTYGLIDNLTFTYNGNQVTRIDDSVNDPTYNGVFNFVDGTSQANEYTYDKNGNLTKDLNKKISLIQYNLLNLPI